MKWIMILFLGFFSCLLHAQQLLNGSFELNDLDCGINLLNDEFNRRVVSTFAFGGQNELDVLTASCNYDYAVDGDYFVALYFNAFSDAFSMSLNEPLQVGQLYHLVFYARNGNLQVSPNSRVQIGLSNTADEFGQELFSTEQLKSEWQRYEVPFSVAEPISFITVKTRSNQEAWSFVDYFHLECPKIDLGPDTLLCDVEQYPLVVSDLFDEVLWSDGTMDDRLLADEPGWYWVEAKEANCVVQDSIWLEEIPFQCQCQYFIPNIFSPNGDGYNDVFLPQTPCELIFYELLILDRWGQIVFRSTDPQMAWDGRVRGQRAGQGQYVYQLQFQYFYEQESTIESGGVLLMR
ncbi:MAG: gliding motility-associated C-terminal domain-containing protein [Bacteroidota bacterium]